MHRTTPKRHIALVVRHNDYVELLICVAICTFCVASHVRHAGHWTVATASALLLALSAPALCKWGRFRAHASLRVCHDQCGVPTGVALLPLLALQAPNAATAAALCTATSAALGLRRCAAHIALALYLALLVAARASEEAQWRSSGSIIMMGAGAVVPHVAYHLATRCARTFTVAEATAVSAAMSSATADALSLLFARPPQVPVRDEQLLRDVSRVALAACVALWWMCVMPLADDESSLKQSHRCAIMRRACSVVSVTYVAAWRFACHAEPITSVLRVLTHRTAWPLLCTWLSLLGAALTCARPDQSGAPRIVARKGYHVLALAIFGLGLQVDRYVLHLGSACALALLLAGEALRVAEAGAVATWWAAVGARLADGRDAGSVTVTHLYLLLGCGGGVWLRRAPVVARGALLAVCVQDAVAAVVGNAIGSRKWGRRGRTVEGSVAGALSAAVLGVTWGGMAPGVAGMAALGTALVEAYTEQIDNWVVPLTFAVLVEAL